MSPQGLSRLWSYLGALLTLYSAGTWINLQGGKSFGELPGLEGRAPITSAYEAILIIGVVLGLLAIVGIAYVRAPRESGLSTLPVVAIGDVGPHDSTSWTMRVYQGVFFALFILLPTASLYQLNSAVMQHGVLWHNGDPALGNIALKNSFTWTRGESDRDQSEYACANEITRPGAYTWMANMRCDVVKANRLQPFEKEGKTTAADIQSKMTAPRCVQELATKRLDEDKCENAKDISEECETAQRHCYGMQWLPVLSPAAEGIATFFGWTMAAWLIMEMCALAFRRRRATSAPVPDLPGT